MSGRRPHLRWLTRLFPARFRDRFEDEMHEVLRAEHESHAAGKARARFWLRQAPGALLGAAREHLAELWMDLRFSLRTFRRQPLFLVISTLSLGVGIGATVTVVATLSAVFIRPLPGVEDQESLLNVKVYSSKLETFDLASYPDYRDLREEASTLAQLAGFSGTQVTLAESSEHDPELVPGKVITSNYFATLGARPHLGRFFSPQEELVAEPVAVISHRLWQQRLGASPELPELWINGVRFEVVGVAPPGFRGHFKGFNFDLFLPVGMGDVAGLPDRSDRSARWVEMVGRLAAGETLDRARADLERRGELLAQNHPATHGDLAIEVEPMTGIDADFRGGLMLFLATLLVVCGLVLLVACINVAGMMLSRTVARRQEMLVRRALGAPRQRLLRQLLTETAALAALAGSLGLLLAKIAAPQVAAAFSSIDTRIGLDIHVDGFTLGAAVAICFLVAFLAGLSPGLEAGRSASLAVGRGTLAPQHRWRRALVVAQVVVSYGVLVSASLFLRALSHATAIDPGFRSEGVLGASVDPGLARLEGEQASELLRQLAERSATLPQVAESALITRVPLGLGARFFPNPLTLDIPGWQPPAELAGWPIEHTVVSPRLLATLEIPLVAGRQLEPGDRESSPPVALVNQTFAERFFPNGEALGRTVREGEREIRIVGVVRDAKYRTLDEGAVPFVYLPFAQRSRSRATLLLRPSGDPESAAEAVRSLVRELAPGLPTVQIGSLEERMAAAFLPQRIGAAASGSLGLLALLLSAVGLYGVLAHWVAARQSEIGLRMSLGAAPSDVMRLVLRQGLGTAGLGVVLGTPAVALGARLFSSFLYGLSPLDPLTYFAVGSLLLAVAGFASLLPAARAAWIDPLVALRVQ